MNDFLESFHVCKTGMRKLSISITEPWKNLFSFQYKLNNSIRITDSHNIKIYW